MDDRWIDVAGLWVHAVDYSPAVSVNRAAPPSKVLLVHGLGASTLSWERVAQPLADALGAPVTAIDLPGFGRTRCTDRLAGFDLHREVLRRVLELEGPAIVVGNSMGGALAATVAARNPELVVALALINAAFPRPVGSFDAITRTMRFATLNVPRVAIPVVQARAMRLGPERLVDVTLAAVFADIDRMDPTLRDRHIALAAERYHYPEAATAYAASGGTLFRYLVTGMRDDLGAIHTPTLVVHGRRDQLVPVSFARAVARRRPEWRYVEFADCGHAPQLEIPERLLEIFTRWVGRDVRAPATSA